MIDTKKMREAVQDKNYRNIWLDGSTHWEGCEYVHYPCAVLALCDEVEKLRAEVATFRELYCTADDKMPPGNITDGFGHWWRSTCRKCGADMVIVRPGYARCSEECYLRDEERKETEE